MFIILYVNLTIQTKLYLDIKKIDVDVQDARQKLFNFYDLFFIHVDFEKVDMIDFHELKERIKNQRKSKKVMNSVVFSNNFQSFDLSSAKNN